MNERILRGWNTWNARSMLSHVHLPEGFAITICFKDNSKAAYMKEVYVGEKGERDAHIFPYEHAYDGSYTRLNLKWNDAEFEVESAVYGDEQIVLLSPVKLPKWKMQLVVEACILWNKPGTLNNSDVGIRAEFDSRCFEVFTSAEPIFDPYPVTQTPFVVCDICGAIAVSTGRRMSVEEARRIVGDNARKHEERLQRLGTDKELYKAMQTCASWATVYDPLKNRVITPVSRSWCKSWSGYVLFCWDNYFVSRLTSVECKEIAYSNLIAITSERTENGFVPNFASAFGAVSRDRSQPPVGAKALVDIYRKWKDKWIVEMLYAPLCVWNDWWYAHRQIMPGLFAWGSDPFEPKVGHYSEIVAVNERFGAAVESGLDNSPMYDDIPFDEDRHMLKLADVGLTGFVIMDTKAMAQLSEIVGDTQNKQRLDARVAMCEQAIQELWSEEDGFFYNKRTDTGEFNKRMSPTNFFALYASSVTPEQCRRVVDEHFYNPQEFWGEYILPSIARNDPTYPEQDYWRGRVWAPLNYLVYGALKERGLAKPAKDLAERSGKLILKEWLENGHVYENYSAQTGVGCDVAASDPFHHWGGLLALTALIDKGLE